MINERVRPGLGATHSADLLIRSDDFAAIEALSRPIAGTRPAASSPGTPAATARRSTTSSTASSCGAPSGRVERSYLDVIDRLVAAGAEGVIAGCTEIELLVGPDDVGVPYFPTTRLHAEAAVDAALAP